MIAGVTAVATMTLAGCGNSAGGAAAGSSPASASGASGKTGMLGYAQCMRQNGVAKFPDPNASGKLEINGNQVDTNSAQFKAANDKCKSLLPAGGNPPPNGQPDPKVAAAQLQYAQCMRDSGVSKFPDPNSDGGIDINGDALGVDPNGTVFKAADAKCKHFLEAVATGPRTDSTPGGSPGH